MISPRKIKIDPNTRFFTRYDKKGMEKMVDTPIQ
jgi:hypothetical protein